MVSELTFKPGDLIVYGYENDDGEVIHNKVGLIVELEHKKTSYPVDSWYTSVKILSPKDDEIIEWTLLSLKYLINKGRIVYFPVDGPDIKIV